VEFDKKQNIGLLGRSNLEVQGFQRRLAATWVAGYWEGVISNSLLVTIVMGVARGVTRVSIVVCGGDLIHEKSEGGLNKIIMCLHGC